MGPAFFALLGAMVIVVVSGLALTRAGHPYSAALLNVHKLVDLAALVAVGVAIFRDSQVAPLSRVAVTAAAIVAVLQALTLVSGGVVSAWKSGPQWVTWSHRVVSWIAVLITVWWGVLFWA